MDTVYFIAEQIVKCNGLKTIGRLIIVVSGVKPTGHRFIVLWLDFTCSFNIIMCKYLFVSFLYLIIRALQLINNLFNSCYTEPRGPLVTIGTNSRHVAEEELDEVNLNSSNEEDSSTNFCNLDKNSNSLLPPGDHLYNSSDATGYNESILSQAASSFSVLPSVASNVLSTFSKRFGGKSSRESSGLTSDTDPNTNNNANDDDPPLSGIHNNLQPWLSETGGNPLVPPLASALNPISTNFVDPTTAGAGLNQEPLPPPIIPKFYSPDEVNNLQSSLSNSSLTVNAAVPTPLPSDENRNNFRFSSKKKYYAPIPGLSGQNNDNSNKQLFIKSSAPVNIPPIPPRTSSTGGTVYEPQIVLSLAPPNQEQQQSNSTNYPVVSSDSESRSGGGGLFSNFGSLVPSGVLQNITGLVHSAADTLTQTIISENNSASKTENVSTKEIAENLTPYPSENVQITPAPINFFNPQQIESSAPINLKSQLPIEQGQKISTTIENTSFFEPPKLVDNFPLQASAAPLPPALGGGPVSYRLQKGTKLYKNPFSVQSVTTAVSPIPSVNPLIPAATESFASATLPPEPISQTLPSVPSAVISSSGGLLPPPLISQTPIAVSSTLSVPLSPSVTSNSINIPSLSSTVPASSFFATLPSTELTNSVNIVSSPPIPVPLVVSSPSEISLQDNSVAAENIGVPASFQTNTSTTEYNIPNDSVPKATDELRPEAPIVPCFPVFSNKRISTPSLSEISAKTQQIFSNSESNTEITKALSDINLNSSIKDSSNQLFNTTPITLIANSTSPPPPPPPKALSSSSGSVNDQNPYRRSNTPSKTSIVENKANFVNFFSNVPVEPHQQPPLVTNSSVFSSVNFFNNLQTTEAKGNNTPPLITENLEDLNNKNNNQLITDNTREIVPVVVSVLTEAVSVEPSSSQELALAAVDAIGIPPPIGFENLTEHSHVQHRGEEDELSTTVTSTLLTPGSNTFSNYFQEPASTIISDNIFDRQQPTPATFFDSISTTILSGEGSISLETKDQSQYNSDSAENPINIQNFFNKSVAPPTLATTFDSNQCSENTTGSYNLLQGACITLDTTSSEKLPISSLVTGGQNIQSEQFTSNSAFCVSEEKLSEESALHSKDSRLLNIWKSYYPDLKEDNLQELLNMASSPASGNRSPSMTDGATATKVVINLKSMNPSKVLMFTIIHFLDLSIGNSTLVL